MASQLQLVAAALFLIVANKVTSQTDSTSFNFPSFSENYLTFQGDAHIQSPSREITLVKTNGSSSSTPLQSSTGRVVYPSPVTFWVPGRQASFQTTIIFYALLTSSFPYGDGLTFFIAPVNSPIPTESYGGNFGIFNPQTGLAPSVFAFEFDYYYQGEDAGWDPDYNHIGIDINSRVSKNTTKWTGTLTGMVTATINYDAFSRTITVVVTQGQKIASLSYVFDLKKVLPQQVQVGISGTTGVGTASVPRLNSWSFTSALVWDSIDDNAENEDEYVKQTV